MVKANSKAKAKKIDFTGKLILAPMSGVTNVAFRSLCAEYGADITVTEFVNCSAIIRGNKSTFKLVNRAKNEKICVVQIFGSNKDEIVEAAKILEKDFDIIDFNCGCPADKVIKIGAGSELLKDPAKIYDIVSALVKAVKKPVTVKIRVTKDLLEIVKLIEKAGAYAITVHGRTPDQGYSGFADWKKIAEVKKTVKIPVIGNGDVISPESAKKLLEEHCVDALMIGRATINNPFIFHQIKEYFKTGKYSEANKKKVFADFMKLATEYDLDMDQIRFHAIHFTKGIPGAAPIRTKIVACKTLAGIQELFNQLGN